MPGKMFPGFSDGKLRVSFGLSILLAFLLAPNLAGQIVPPRPSPGRPAAETDIYLVTFQPGTTASERAAVAQQAGAVLRRNFNIVNAVSVQVPNDAALARLRNNPRVLGVFANHSVSLHAGQIGAQAKGGNPGGGSGGGGGKGGGKPKNTAPAITDFTPTSGSVGTSVTITGTGFTDATQVAFNGMSANFTWDSDMAISTAVPTGTTTGPIAVTTPNGTATSTTEFTVTIVSSPPSAPGSLSATAVSYRQIDLVWADNSGNEDGFRIERCTGAGCTSFAQIFQVGPNVASYSNLGLTENTTYRYRVRAFNSDGNSAYSPLADATTPAAPSSSQVVPAGVQRIGAAPGELSVTGAGVGVAIVDTGLDFDHPDLGLAPEVPGQNAFSFFSSSCQDIHGHGTHVAGIVAARDNTIDVVGVAPDATLYCVKPFTIINDPDFGPTPGATDESIVAGLDWVASRANELEPPIRVVNMSLGRPREPEDDDPNHPWHLAVQALHASNISVVVAAGNDSSIEVSQMVPASYPEVMAIASTPALDGFNGYPGDPLFIPCPGEQPIKADTASYFTTDGMFLGGTGVTVSAPGEEREDVFELFGTCFVESVGILSTWPGNATIELSGTSMASPHVAGVMALMWQKDLSLGLSLAPEVARTRIRDSVDRPGTAPLDSAVDGYSFDGEREGILLAPAAVGDAPPPEPDLPPTVSITSPANGSTFSSGESIHFVGAASDAKDGILTASLTWTSNRDGQFGSGGDFWTALSSGSHTITASATDSGGNVANASITITVGSPTQSAVVGVSSITYGMQGPHLLINVEVDDDFGGPIAGALVSIQLYEWLWGNGPWYADGTTNSQGMVQFKLSNAPWGCYRTGVMNVLAEGLTWDGVTPENSFCNL